MILDRMHLTNFKRFKDTEIDFKHGITGIVGMNGTGKSSGMWPSLRALPIKAFKSSPITSAMQVVDITIISAP